MEIVLPEAGEPMLMLCAYAPAKKAAKRAMNFMMVNRRNAEEVEEMSCEGEGERERYLRTMTVREAVEILYRGTEICGQGFGQYIWEE